MRGKLVSGASGNLPRAPNAECCDDLGCGPGSDQSTGVTLRGLRVQGFGFRD